MQIKINKEYASLVPQLTSEEYESLKESIKQDGLFVPLIINKDGVLLDGHHRYKACKELGIEISQPDCKVKEFQNKLDEKLFVIDCNLNRRPSKGYTQREIAQTLQIAIATVNKDISFLRQQAKANIEKYVNEKLPEEFQKCLVGLNAVLKHAWNIYEKASTANATASASDRREQIQALDLVKEVYSKKLELLSDATVIDQAMKFVTRKKSELLEFNSCHDNNSKTQQQHSIVAEEAPTTTTTTNNEEVF
jgi:ParB-like chromosome segregation protein Spo0J